MMRPILALAAVLLAGCAGGPRRAATPEAPTDAPAGDAYYLSVCASCAGMLGAKGDTLDRVYGGVHAGRDARFCCAECLGAFERDPAAGFERVDQLMIQDQRTHYPLKTSIVTGRPLPASPLDFIRGNRLFRVADARERTAIERDPGRYFRALDRAVLDAQTPEYGMPDKCPVQGDILDSDAVIDIVIANRMIRVCCMRCVRVVRNRPSQYLALVDYANRQAAQGAEP